MSPTPSTTFAELLEQLRRARGLTPAEMARRLDVSEAQVSRWRSGKGVPALASLERISQVFGVDRSMLEELAGLRASTQGESGAINDPELAALVDAERAELQEELKGIPRPFWPAILSAQRAARRGMMQGISLVQSEGISSSAADRISSPAASDRPSGEGDFPGSDHALAPVFSLAA